MKFPRLKKIYVRGIGFVEVRPYLTTNEIDAILSTIQSQTTDYAMRIMMMYSMVMPLCTDLKDFATDEVNIDVVESKSEEKPYTDDDLKKAEDLF